MNKIIFTIIVFLLGMTFTYAVDLILSKDVIYDNTSSVVIDSLISKFNSLIDLAI